MSKYTKKQLDSLEKKALKTFEAARKKFLEDHNINDEKELKRKDDKPRSDRPN